MKAKIRFTLLAMVFALAIFGIAYHADASPGFATQYNTYFGTSVTCTLCHTTPPRFLMLPVPPLDLAIITPL